MKLFVGLTLVCAGVLTILAGISPVEPKASPKGLPHVTVWERVHKSSHHVLVNKASRCSGNMIAPHTMLITTHCFWDKQHIPHPPTSVILDEKQLVTYDGMEMDQTDHVFLFFKESFPNYVRLIYPLPTVVAGEEVFLWGNPGGFRDQLRFGKVTGFCTKETDFMRFSAGTFLDYNGYNGDSGSSVFNMKGQIVGIISATSNSPMFHSMYIFTFTPEQLAKVH